jgi:hypothetical protein
MSGSGQLIGGIIGAVVSIFVPGAGMAVGWAVGSLLGGFLIRKEPTKGPRLEDIKVQSSEYGRPIPIVYGQIGLQGNVIWLAPIIERSHEEGGKGGGDGVTVYDYYATFAVAFCEGTHQITRLWAGLEKRLIYDVNSPVANNGFGLRLYTGSEDQLPDPTMESFEGVGNVPGYRGTVYAVFTDFPLKTDNNTVPLITAEFGTTIAPLNEWVYHRTRDEDLGALEYQIAGASCYVPADNTFWTAVHFMYMGTGTYSDSQAVQVIDRSTMHVLTYIPKTLEPGDSTWTEGELFVNSMWYDSFTDCVYIIGPSSNLTSSVDNSIYKYSRAGRNLLSKSTPGGNFVKMKQWYNPYTGECYLMMRNSNLNTPVTTPSFGKVDLASMTFSGAQTMTWITPANPGGYAQTAFHSIYPGQTVFTATGRIFQICQLPQIAPHNAAVSGLDASNQAALDICQYLYEYDPTTGQLINRGGISPTYAYEGIGSLIYCEERNAVYAFTTSPEVGFTSDRVERVFKFDLGTNTLTYQWDLPAYDRDVVAGSTTTVFGGSKSIAFFVWDAGLNPYFVWDKYRNQLLYPYVYVPADDWTFPPDGIFSTVNHDYQHYMDHTRVLGLNIDTGSVINSYPLDSQLLPQGQTYYDWQITDNTGMLTPLADGIYLRGTLYVRTGYDGTFPVDSDDYQYDGGPQGAILLLGSAAGNPIVHLWEVVTDLSIRAGLTPADLDVAELTDIVDGYAVAKPTPVREAIDVLRPVYSFDGVESEGKNKFRKRGRAVQTILNADYLRAFSPGSTSARDPLLTIRKMDQELPNQVTLTYLTPAKKYDTAVKYARRLTQHGNTDYSLAVSMQFSDTKAQEVANNNLWAAWVERVTYEFQLPYNYACALEPTDKVQIAGYTMRIIKATLTPHGAISFEAVRDQGLTSDVIESIYNDFSPTVITETPTDVGTLPAAQVTNLELL